MSLILFISYFSSPDTTVYLNKSKEIPLSVGVLL